MYVVPVKSKVEISQLFVAFSEHMNFTKNVGVLVNLWRIMFNLPASFFDGLSKVFKSKFYKCIVTFYKCIVTIRLPVSRWLRKQEMQPFFILFFVYCNQVWNMKLVLEEKKVPSLLFHFQEGLCFESSSTNAVDFASKISRPLTIQWFANSRVQNVMQIFADFKKCLEICH